MRACSATSIVDTVAAVISEAGKFATEAIAPLDRVGDRERRALRRTASSRRRPGFRDAYRRWAEAGWAGVTASPEYGGMGLPHAVDVACGEMWSGASMGFALCPLLGEGGDWRAQGLRKRRVARDLSAAASSPANGPGR